ncbi:hypothetical protein [Brevundimonas viscosa]|uniref:Uncharacterized protein n=1 Tax=Brevundimonas viscosa TaxID=871741 RepID=A0A1I6P0K0_9CAUL|nr:hypothetical protein [Brevundimonas viscosa]SFS33618.1 hypothetical protein SAMN05192570_0711 [Brevundimonas viscosa]
MRSYYRRIGRTMMAFGVSLPIFFTLLTLGAVGAEVDHSDSMREAVGALLGVYAASSAAFLIGRVLARIPPVG